MQVTINDEPRTLDKHTSVPMLLKQLGLEKSACAVEINRRLVPKAQHEQTMLAEGDKVEVVALVGGG